MRLIQTFLVFVFNLSLILTLGQEPITIHIDESDGLPDLTVYGMVEDWEGFKWLSTSQGLVRYDGKEYLSYTHKDKKSRAVFNLQLDKNGRVWCNNIVGQFFYIEDDKMVLYKDFLKELNRQALANFLVFEDKLFIKNSQNILVYDVPSKQLIDTIGNISATSVGLVHQNEFIYIESNGNNFQKVMKYGDSNFEFSHLTVEEVANRHCSFFTYDKEHFFLLLTDRILNKSSIKLLNLDNKLSTNLELPEELRNTLINGIFKLKEQLYIATSKGVFITNLNNESIQVEYHFLKKEFTTSVLVDDNGMIWVSTLNNGLYILPNNNILRLNQLTNIDLLKKKNDSICYVAHRNGELSTLNINTNKLHPFHNQNLGRIRALDYDSSSNSFFYSSDRYSCIFNDDKNVRTCFTSKSATKSASRIKDSTYVISRSNGVYIVSPHKSKRITNIRSFKSIYSVKSNQIYNCDIEGVKVLDMFTMQSRNVLHKGKPIQAFDLVETSDGIIWLATFDDGVIGIQNDEVIRHLKKQSGLISNKIGFIQADGNNLWIVCNKGIQLYDSNNDATSVITKLDGINSFGKGKLEVMGNRVLFANNDGVFSFNKNNVFKVKDSPQAYFKSILINNVDYGIRNQYRVDYDESNIEINFNTKEFESLKHVSYQYRLNKEDTWIDVKPGVDHLKLISLPVGKFNFELRAKHHYDLMYSDIIGFKIKVLAPFYQKWWFIVLLSLILIALIYWNFNRKTKKLKDQQSKALEKERISRDLVLSQLENLRSQMNPHFIFNALNSIQDYIILNEKKLARQFLIKFSRLIRIYLEHSQKDNVSLEEELTALNLYLELEKDRFNDELIYDIQVDKRINPTQIYIPSLFIQPYVENAIKHGLLHKEGLKNLNIKFSLEEKGQVLVCFIDDNGIGRVASEKINRRRNPPSSFATSANQRRIDLLNSWGNKRITVEIRDKLNDDNQPSGTLVIIKYFIQTETNSSIY